MKLEVGMYVRTKGGRICKMTKTNIVGKYYYLDILEERKIIKASHNIIDLIEVGDYVNGDRIDEIENGELRFHWDYEYSEYISYYENKDIKSIVTKEQFESMSYKVEE